jgi:glycosyltransferase involved in cell wall biosynthesis
MARYIVVKDGRIRAVSSTEITSVDEVIQLPPELDDVATSTLMSGFQARNGVIERGQSLKPAARTKIAFVGNWKMRCGISTYAEKLWPPVAVGVQDWRIFAERNVEKTGPLNIFGGVEVDPLKVVECWSRGEPLGELVKQLRDYAPDVVWIQHEYGLWPNARHWLALMSQLAGMRVIVTLHSVYFHMDKLVSEAAIPEIVVHLEGAKRVLEDVKHVPGAVHLMTHGCDPVGDRSRLWNIYRSEHTFAQFGFGFRYKGWENSIRAVAELKKKHPDVFFTGLFSESSYSTTEHETYHADLMRLTRDLGVEDNVALIRGFQSDESLDSYLRTNRAVVFPYVSHPDHEVFGVSGAARYAMSKNVPIVTTSVNHFSDVPTIKADTPEAIAAALDELFSSRVAWEKQVQKQTEYALNNSWENVAKRFLELLETGR